MPSISRTELSEEVACVERMEGEGGHPRGSEGDLGAVTDPDEYGDKPGITTPRTIIPTDEGYDDDSAEGGEVKSMVVSGGSKREGCNCNCPGHCPEDCPPSCGCSAHARNKSGYAVSGDEP